MIGVEQGARAQGYVAPSGEYVGAGLSGGSLGLGAMVAYLEGGGGGNRVVCVVVVVVLVLVLVLLVLLVLLLLLLLLLL